MIEEAIHLDIPLLFCQMKRKIQNICRERASDCA